MDFPTLLKLMILAPVVVVIVCSLACFLILHPEIEDFDDHD